MTGLSAVQGDATVKPYLNAAVVGAAGSGKTSLIGHLVYIFWKQNKQTDWRVKKALKGQQLAKGIQYDMILEHMRTDRERCSSVQRPLYSFETTVWSCNVVDTAGIASLADGMFTAVLQADLLLVVVSCVPSEFDDNQMKLLWQTVCGVGRPCIVAVSKMDHPEVMFNETVYTDIKSRTLRIMKAAKLTKSFRDKTMFVPVSTAHGDNLLSISPRTIWYSGRPLIEALDICPEPYADPESPLRLAVHDVFKIGGIGTIIVGRVEQGVIRCGMNIKLACAGITAEVRDLEINKVQVDEGRPGATVSIHVRGVDVRSVHPGELISDAKCPVHLVSNFTAKVKVLPEAFPIVVGDTFTCILHAASVPCTVNSLLGKYDASFSTLFEDNPRRVDPGDCASICLVPEKPLCTEAQTGTHRSSLNRVVLRHLQRVVASGIVESVVHQPA
ncbi:Tr-type G domain-containing protein [Plasmodiophora brassicae]